jgi:cation diffusion facilitator CzcD-associated flavoprotein CzcO
MLEWIIVGGGVHGTCVSHYLTSAVPQLRERIAVLDPHGAPLAAWQRAGSATGMDFLRSPMAHHIDVDELSLLRFASAMPALARFAPPAQRPARDLFDAHAERVVEEHGLAALRVKATVTRIAALAGGWRVETSVGSLDGRRVVLALGPGDHTHWPVWATEFRARGGRIEHVLDPGFRRDSLAGCSTVVIGGGISAAQLALALADLTPGVVMVTRHAPRLATQDAELGWLDGAALARFVEVGGGDERRHVIAGARRRGTMPADVAERLLDAHAEGRVTLVIGAVERATRLFDGRGRLELADRELISDRIVLATGFDPRRPGGRFVDRAIRELGLPTARCGYPVVNGRLEWAPGLHVTGALADLQLGPLSRGIGGGRRAATILTRIATA